MSSSQKIQTHPTVVEAQKRVNYYISQLDKELTKYPALNTLEQRVQIPKAYAVIGAVTVFTLLIFINPLAAPVSNIIGWALPAYLSFKALETPQPQDDTQWLTYWTVYGFFTFIESLALRLVLHYFPYYFPFKAVFLIWLQSPASKGANKLYYSVLRPMLVKDNYRVATSTTSTTPEELRSKVNDAQ
jgi:receptor expression-enhancing protein 5/6